MLERQTIEGKQHYGSVKIEIMVNEKFIIYIIVVWCYAFLVASVAAKKLQELRSRRVVQETVW